jgi:pilus assembly protein CpaB
MTRQQAVTIVTIVSLLFAGLASWGVYRYLQQAAQKSSANQLETIVVAAGELPIGTKLDLTQMKTSSIAKASMPAGSFSDSKALVGRVVIRPVSIGDAITEQKLMPKEGKQAGGVMSYIIPDGHRAITVAVNEVAGVAGFISPNTRVDVVLTTLIPNNPRNESISKIILQNVTVLATGQITDQKDGKPVVVPTVTLDLSPDNAEKLVLGASKGSLQLLLRNIADNAPVEGSGATITKVLGGVEAPVKPVAAQKPVPAVRSVKAVKTETKVLASPAVPQVKRHTVEIIKGRDRTTKEFSQ